MSEREEFEIKGLPELLAKLDALPAKINQRVLRQATLRAAQMFRHKVASALPVGTTYRTIRRKTKPSFKHNPGYLRQSVEAKRSRGKPGEVAAKVTVGAFYARFLEKGTKNITARHYVENVFRSSQEEIANALSAEIIAGIEKEAKKQ